MRRAAVLLVLIGWAQSGGAAEDVKISPSRDEVWRAIFARPVGPPPGGTIPDERVALGRDLFRDPRLSGDGRSACVSCHIPERAFTDGRAKGRGPRGVELARNVPALYNLAWAKAFFWDGRAETLEEQARGPILSADEMASDFDTIVSRLKSDPEMADRFSRAFPEDPVISEKTVLSALAAYERSLVSAVTPFDRWVMGDDAALGAREKEGFGIFVGKGGCVACHGGWRFTDDGFHDIGLRSSDPGRGAVDRATEGLPLFKTPSLRELKYTAPYMHDGSLATLADVVDHYAEGVVKRPSNSANLVQNLTLSEGEKQSLIAFLNALSSDALTETSRLTPKN